MSVTNPFDLRGKSFLIVGGAGYLGLPACKLLAELGASLVIADRDEPLLEAAGRALRDATPEACVTLRTVEVGDESSVTQLVEDTIKTHRRLDGMVNAVATASGMSFDDLTAEALERANKVNLSGFFLLARSAAEAMNDGGSVVLLSSMYGMVAPDPRMYEPPMEPNPVEYGIAKAGILQMVRYMAAHYGPRNIRFNAIAPGPFPHPNGLNTAEFVQRLADRTMLGRVGEQDEIAGSIAFLLSSASTYMTGQCLTVDGGWTAW
ncbi:MAG: SDR family oxidoreductase [Phycisphaeraceae bacterium]